MNEFKHKQVSVSIPFDGERPVWRRRAWGERLFSWPWRPWQQQEFVGTFGDMVTETIRKNEALMLKALDTPLYRLLKDKGESNSSPTD
jgi:hypothetical protein